MAHTPKPIREMGRAYGRRFPQEGMGRSAKSARNILENCELGSLAMEMNAIYQEGNTEIGKIVFSKQAQ